MSKSLESTIWSRPRTGRRSCKQRETIGDLSKLSDGTENCDALSSNISIILVRLSFSNFTLIPFIDNGNFTLRSEPFLNHSIETWNEKNIVQHIVFFHTASSLTTYRSKVSWKIKSLSLFERFNQHLWNSVLSRIQGQQCRGIKKSK